MDVTFKLGCWFVLSSDQLVRQANDFGVLYPGSFPKVIVNLILYVSTGFIFPQLLFLLLLFICFINKPNETIKSTICLLMLLIIKTF